MSSILAIEETDAPGATGGRFENDASSSITASAVSALLQDQYASTEAYCNAATALFQVVQSPSTSEHPLYTSIRHHQEALSRLQYILHQLEQMVVRLEQRSIKGVNEEESLFLRLWNGAVVLREHWECTRRIMGTLYKSCAGMSWDRYGLPKGMMPSFRLTGGVHVELVALATLRASIQKVQESLPP